MFISPQPVTGLQDIPSSENRGKNILDKHDFLQLLVMQLRYQNPLEPMDEREFGTQLAQYATLEEMQNSNKQLSTLVFLQAGSMIGKTVYLKDGTMGTVTGAVIRDQESLVEVNGEMYPIYDVVGMEG